MNKCTAYLLLLIFLFSALVPQRVKSELERLPALARHFQVHKIEQPEISFFQFLELHYGENFAQHRSQHPHGDLPFKCNGHHHSTTVVASVFLPSEASFSLKINVSPVSEKRQFPPTDRYFSVAVGDIWQPPRA